MDTGTIRIAYMLIPLLVMTLGVAFIAFVHRSRLVVVSGLAGSYASQLVPTPKTYTLYQSTEAAVMGSFTDSMYHSVACGLVCTSLGLVAAFVILRFKSKNHRTAVSGVNQMMHRPIA